MANDFQAFAEDDFCYLTTTGRVSGRPHTIEIWFALEGHALYMLAGGRSDADWVKNLMRTPAVQLRLREQVFAGTARVVAEPAEDALARELVVGKYTARGEGDLDEWGRTALAVAVDMGELVAS
jgi:deazaflavin-dependent oxidoreductase (nitroreductase family)